MTVNWNEVALGDVFKFSSGKAIAPNGSGQYPAFGSNGLIGHSNESLFPSGVIIGRVGAYCGSVVYTQRPFWASDNTIVARPIEDKLDQRFSYYLLLSAKLNSWAGGAAQPLLTQSVLKPLRFSIPPLDEQRRIASILGAYDDLIAVNRRRIALLEEMARRLFSERIVRGVGGLPEPGGAIERSLPAGWSVRPLRDVSTILMGQSPPSRELNSAQLGLVFHQGVTEFGALFPGRRVFCAELAGKRIAEVGDILFSVRAPVGRINSATERVVLGRGVAAIREKNGFQWFLLAHFLMMFHTPDLIGNGSIYKAVTRGDVDRIPIVCPPHGLLAATDRQLRDLFALQWAFERANRALVEARDLVLPRLISGELSVSAAERELEAAA